jgi:pyridoxal phosphate enzyme (YggS family)
MVDIALNISKLKEQIPPSVKIVAVSKTRSVNEILIAYNAGQRLFGENRVQELLLKKDHLPGDIEWHLIGHLQSNKVKNIVPFISMIHSVDSARLLEAINNAAEKAGRTIHCLLQFHIAKEETKFGFNMDEINLIFGSSGISRFSNITIRGVMGMATFTDNMEIVKQEFQFLRNCFSTLREKYFYENESFNEISMGMSGDFMTAIGAGSTIVRIGSLIFGERK